MSSRRSTTGRDELFRLVLTAGDVARRCYERLALHAETQIDWWLVDVWTAGHRARPAHAARPGGRRLRAARPAGRRRRAAGRQPTRYAGPHADVVHLDLGADGGLVGPVPVGWTPALVIVTACGTDCSRALADIRAGAEVPVNRLNGRNVVILADRAAAAAVPA